MKNKDMLSTKPYLIRAFYDWIVDSECTPHIVVDAMLPNVFVPKEYVTEGKIILNIGSFAVTDFMHNDYEIKFVARFGNMLEQICVPINSILAIYAKENKRGITFEDNENSNNLGGDDPDSKLPKVPHLKIIK